MENDKIHETSEGRSLAEQEVDKSRSAVTILFSDIKGTTAYFDEKGDAEGLAMLQYHDSLLIPVIEGHGGRVVKKIGDAIMACFDESTKAIQAAIGMQQTLVSDRASQSPDRHIHVRLGLHSGYGLVQETDVFSDVVNAASRVQQQARPDQIFVSEALLGAAKRAGLQCVRMNRTELKGKEEPIDVYAVVWSEAASDQLIEDLHFEFEKKLKDAKRQREELERDFENARDQWRSERRKLTATIGDLEEAVERARRDARKESSEGLHAEIRFQLDEAVRLRQQTEQELVAGQAKFEVERKALRDQIASMQGASLEAMERSNNPARLALAVREQVDARLTDARQQWQAEWEGERRLLTAEIERLKKSAAAPDERKEAAKRALLEKLGKIPAGSGGPEAKTAEQWDKEFSEATIKWETERDQLELKVRSLERELQGSTDKIRSDMFQEMRGQYEPKLQQATRDAQRMQAEIDALSSEFKEERVRFTDRIALLEQAIPRAQEAARTQATAELQADFEARIEELQTLKARTERKFHDDLEEIEIERRRTRKRITQLEDELKEGRAAGKADRK